MAVAQLLPETEVSPAVIKFGTVGPIKVLRALQAENWFHHKSGCNQLAAHPMKVNLLRAFYPDSDDWRSAVWQQGYEVIGKALNGLSQLH